MARVYSHRRSTSQKKAKPMEAIYMSGVSILSIIVYLVLMAFSVANAGENSRWIGGVGILGLAIAIWAFVFNFGQMRKDTDFKERVICMVISSLALLAWVVTLVIGMFN